MTQISINYAIVLYQLGVSKEDIRYCKELFEAADALYESLASPVVTLHEKYVVIDRLFPESMRAFFKVLCRNQSVSLIDEIFQAYRDYADEQENVLRAKLFYVEKPQEKQVEGLTAYLSKRFHKNKFLKYRFEIQGRGHNQYCDDNGCNIPAEICFSVKFFFAKRRLRSRGLRRCFVGSLASCLFRPLGIFCFHRSNVFLVRHIRREYLIK